MEEEYGELGEGSAGRLHGAGRSEWELGGKSYSGGRLRLEKDESGRVRGGARKGKGGAFQEAGPVHAKPSKLPLSQARLRTFHLLVGFIR